MCSYFKFMQLFNSHHLHLSPSVNSTLIRPKAGIKMPILYRSKILFWVPEIRPWKRFFINKIILKRIPWKNICEMFLPLFYRCVYILINRQITSRYSPDYQTVNFPQILEKKFILMSISDNLTTQVTLKNNRLLKYRFFLIWDVTELLTVSALLSTIVLIKWTFPQFR